MSLVLSQPPLSMPGAPSNRALALCVLGSLALHVAVLLLFPAMRQQNVETQGTVKVLTARLASVATPAPPAPAVAEPERRPEPPPAVKPPPAPPPVAKPAPRPAVEPPRPVLTQPVAPPTAPIVPPPVVTPAPVPPPVPAPAAPVPPLASAPPSVPAPAAPPSAPPAAVPSVPSAAPQAPAAASPQPPALSGDEAGSLEQYRMSLIVAARRYKRYPAVAMEKGWQGRVEVRLLIGPNGMTRSAVIQRSSGHEILDATALDMVRKAKPLTQIPAALRGKDFAVDVPVIFDLSQG